MNKLMSATLLLFFATLQAYAQAQNQTAQSTATTARVNKLFARWDKPTSPGCALAVIKDGRIIYKRGYGMANLDHDIPITTTSIFHVASVSKHFTAAAVALLAQRNKLSLDDPVRKYIPELPDFGEPITIRHLIYHTSGLRDQWTLLGLAGLRYSLDRIADRDVLDVIARQKELNFRPGEKFLYCNTGYTLLAMIVARVSGQSFREFTDANIFRPLGMKNSHFRDDHAEVVKNHAYGYLPTPEGAFRLGATNFDTTGATSLLTTVEDVALWDQNFYNKKVGGPALIEQMHERGKLNNGEVLNYAFALNLSTYRGVPIVEHSGSDAGYRAHLIRFPEQHFSVACFCNAGPVDITALTRKVADIYLEAEFKDTPAEQPVTSVPVLSETQLRSKEGLYVDLESGGSARVIMKDKQLTVQAFGRTFTLRPLSEARFQVVERPMEKAQFDKPPGSSGPRLVMWDEFGRKAFYDYMPPYTLPSDQLSDYVGDYVSDEIEPVFRMRMQGDKLALTRLKYRPVMLQPIMRDVFLTDSGTIRFTRNAQDQISGFIYNLSRVRNFRMKK
ncbi:MAG: beta-lactamase family protein [Acidobacteria bacterium]|nr:beta-lactamase family protein [Acidobacteriota bacterium]